MKKLFALALALVLALSLTVASADELKVIRVGATARTRRFSNPKR
mgnify:CR=1 FL=1